MNEICNKLFEILKGELSEITSKSIVESKCKSAGKDTLETEDVKNLKSQIVASVLLYGGAEKAKRVKEKLDGL